VKLTNLSLHLPYTGRKTRVSSRSPGLIFKDNYQFSIESVERHDSGNYSCIARNAFGTNTQSTLLIVKGLF